MSGVVLTLGGVAFRGMEVPEAVSFGGWQRVAALPLIGGGRAVQAMGVDEGVISFRGIFTGTDAAARAQWLDAARATGAVLPLVWDRFYYLVVIERFAAEYRKPNLIPFEIVCVVADDVASVVVAPLSALIGADLAAATGLSAQTGITLPSADMAAAASYAGVQTQMGAVTAATGTAVTTAGAMLATANDADNGINGMSGLCAAAGQLAAAAQMRGYVNRAVTNLGMALA